MFLGTRIYRLCCSPFDYYHLLLSTLSFSALVLGALLIMEKYLAEGELFGQFYFPDDIIST